jgi:hypothetical protein
VICTNFFNQSEALINIGIEAKDGIGCEITTSHLMPNYQYDCTTTNIPVCETNNGGNVFSHVCVG